MKRAVVMLAAAAVTLLVAPAVAHATGASGPTALELLPGMTRGVARAVNAAGVIVGDESTGTHPVPVRWVNGHVTALEIPAGYTGSAVDVNNPRPSHRVSYAVCACRDRALGYRTRIPATGTRRMSARD